MANGHPLNEDGGRAKFIGFKTPDAHAALYRRVAEARGLTLSELLREALYEHLTAAERKEFAA